MSDTETKLLQAGAGIAGVAVLAQERLKRVAAQNGIEAAGEKLMSRGVVLSAETGSAGAEASAVVATGGSALIPTAGTAVVAAGEGGALVATGGGGALVVGGEGAALAAGVSAVTLGTAAVVAPVAGAAAIVGIAAHEVNKERQKLEDNIASIKPELEGSKKFGNVVHEMQVISKTLDAAGAKKDEHGNYDLTDANTVKIVGNALKDRAQTQQQIADDNHLSLPAWMDWSESRGKERNQEDLAKDELARVRAAQAELLPMAQEAQAKKAASQLPDKQVDTHANPEATQASIKAIHKPKLIATESNRQAQAALAELGYTENAKFAIRSGQTQFDGKEGALTDKDVTNFQKDHQKDGLKITGKLDEETLAALAQEVRKLKSDGISVEGIESAMLKPLDTPVSAKTNSPQK